MEGFLTGTSGEDGCSFRATLWESSRQPSASVYDEVDGEEVGVEGLVRGGCQCTLCSSDFNLLVERRVAVALM